MLCGIPGQPSSHSAYYYGSAPPIVPMCVKRYSSGPSIMPVCVKRYISGPFMVPVCANRKYRHHSGQPALFRILLYRCWVFPYLPNSFHRHCSGQPALLKKHYREGKLFYALAGSRHYRGTTTLLRVTQHRVGMIRTCG